MKVERTYGPKVTENSIEPLRSIDKKIQSSFVEASHTKVVSVIMSNKGKCFGVSCTGIC